MNNKFITILVIFFFISMSFFVTQKAHAGVIIRGPAYLGLQSGLVGCWSFDQPETSGTTSTDCSTNSNDGTLTGGPTRTIGKVGQAHHGTVDVDE